MKTYHSLPFLILVILFSCTVARNVSTENNWGCVKICPKYWDSVNQQFVFMPRYGPECRIWFKDSLIIEEVFGLNFSQEGNEPEKTWFSCEPYIFADLRKNVYYKYSSFSDTARLIGKIDKTDSLKWGVPWDFYTPKGDFYRENLQVMADTVIEGIVFKRWAKPVSYFFKGENRTANHIMYLRCDKKNTLIQFDDRFIKKMGCPLVKIELEYYSNEIKFLSDTLTAEEIKVFNAWEKRAKED